MGFLEMAFFFGGIMGKGQREKKKLYETFFKYVSLNVLSMIGFSAFILADTFFIANGIGKDGLVALNIVIPAYTLIYATSLLLGNGVGTMFSIYKGDGRQKRGSEMYTMMILVGIGIGLLYTALGLLFPEEIVMLLGADGKILDLSLNYTTMVFPFSAVFMVSSMLVSMVRNDKRPKLAMTAMMAGSLSNILLDYIFIYPLNLGMAGAALATGIAPIISILVLLPYFIRKENTFHLIRFPWRPGELKKVISIGMPSFITELSSGLVILLFNLVILEYVGETGVAAYGILANLALILIAVFSGAGQGIQPIVSYNHGQGNKENIRHTLRLGLFFSFFLGVVLYLFFMAFPEEIIRAFNPENNLELYTIAKDGMALYFTSFFFAGVNIMIISYFSSKAKARVSFMISMLRGIVLIPFALFLLAPALGINGIWLTIPLVEFITLLLGLYLIFTENKKEEPSHKYIV